MVNYWLKDKLKMWTNECDYIIAHTLEEAKLFVAQVMFGKVPDALKRYLEFEREELDNPNWDTLNPDSSFTFREDNGTDTIATVQEFIFLHGPGYFACSEY